MLQLTKDAATFIRTARQQQALSEEVALRVDRASSNGDGGLRLGFVEVIPDGDRVGQSEGISVCVDSTLADALDDKLIDGQATLDGVDLVLRTA